MESTDAPGEKAVTEEEVKELMENQVRCLLCAYGHYQEYITGITYSHVCIHVCLTLKVMFING